MTAIDAATGCSQVDLGALSNSGGNEALPAATAVAEFDAANALASESGQQPGPGSAVDIKSAATWLGLCHALTKAPCLASPTATPISDPSPSLSEVSSSHGQSPRSSMPDPAPCRPSPLRWADEPEAEGDSNFTFNFGQDVEAQEEDADDAEESFEQGTDATTPSKRSRRSNRRRRARAEKAALGGLTHGMQGGAMKDARDATMAYGTAGGLKNISGGIRNSVTVSDLLCASPQARANGRSPMAASPNGGMQEEVGWWVPASPCRAQVGGPCIMSTSPCAAPAGKLTFGYNANANYLGQYSQSPQACMSPFFAVPMTDGSNMWASTSPAMDCSPSPCRAISGPAGIFCTSPTAGGMEASARSPAPLPVGPVGTTPLGSPCHARIGNGTFSTSPTNGCHSAPALPACALGQLGMGPSLSEVDPAGSPSADALRSWLHGSGIGASCADLAYQLRAAAPEVYDD